MPVEVTLNSFAHATSDKVFLSTPLLGDHYAVFVKYKDHSYGLGFFSVQADNLDLIVNAINDHQVDLKRCTFFVTAATAAYVTQTTMLELQEKFKNNPMLANIILEIENCDVADKLIVKADKVYKAKSYISPSAITPTFTAFISEDLTLRHKLAIDSGLVAQPRQARKKNNA